MPNLSLFGMQKKLCLTPSGKICTTIERLGAPHSLQIPDQLLHLEIQNQNLGISGNPPRYLFSTWDSRNFLPRREVQLDLVEEAERLVGWLEKSANYVSIVQTSDDQICKDLQAVFQQDISVWDDLGKIQERLDIIRRNLAETDELDYYFRVSTDTGDRLRAITRTLASHGHFLGKIWDAMVAVGRAWEEPDKLESK